MSECTLAVRVGWVEVQSKLMIGHLQVRKNKIGQITDDGLELLAAPCLLRSSGTRRAGLG